MVKLVKGGLAKRGEIFPRENLLSSQLTIKGLESFKLAGLPAVSHMSEVCTHHTLLDSYDMAVLDLA